MIVAAEIPAMRLNNANRPGLGRPGRDSPSVSGLHHLSEKADPAHQPLRVLHIAQSIAGGIASYFDELAPYQNAVFGSANVAFMVPAGSERHLTAIAPEQIVTFPATSRSPAALLRFALAARTTIRSWKPDIVHLHSSFAGAMVRAFMITGRTRPKIVYCPHGWAFGMETSSASRRLYVAIEKRLVRRSDLVLVNSDFELQLAECSGLPRNKLLTVPNGISWAPRPRRNDRKGALQLAFVGRHDRQKGLDVLLDTIDRSSLLDIHLHIVGENVVGQRSGRLGPARANVTCHGWLSRAELLRLMADMDAVVMPSRWEAFGLVATEAMRAGVAVIASNRGALPEVVRDGVGGCIFDLDDTEALGRLLQRIDRQQLIRLGRSARARWEEEYPAERMNRSIHEAYARVLGLPADFPLSAPAAVPSPQSAAVAAGTKG